jgi:transposase
MRHRVLATVSENQVAVEKLREKAGCLVLLTNVPVEEKKGLEILRIYKEQDGIERNFGFLKDPLDQVQLAYLSALEVHPAVFTKMGSSTGSIRSGYH